MATDENGKQVGRLLPNRRNIILTQDNAFEKEGAEIVYSVEETMELLRKSTKPEEEVFIIGGGMIYKLFIELANKPYITHVDANFSDAEIFFPAIDSKKWAKTKSEKYSKDESMNMI